MWCTNYPAGAPPIWNSFRPIVQSRPAVVGVCSPSIQQCAGPALPPPPLSRLMHCEQKLVGSPKGTSKSTLIGPFINPFIYCQSRM